MQKYLIEEMTFLEFRQSMQKDLTILVPLGSVEIQGPCNPMGDFMLARELAVRAAQNTGALVAPTLPFGFAPGFKCVPGGMQLSHSTFCAVLRDMLDSFLDHGIRRLLIVNGHTGNNGAIDLTLREIRSKTHVVIPWINIWPLVPSTLREQAHGANVSRASGHGCDPIGSVYEFLFPQLTRRDAATNTGTGKTFFGLPTEGLNSVSVGDFSANVPLNILDHCDYVTAGDPSLANATAGKLFADYIVGCTEKLIRHIQSLPAPEIRPS